MKEVGRAWGANHERDHVTCEVGEWGWGVGHGREFDFYPKGSLRMVLIKKWYLI